MVVDKVDNSLAAAGNGGGGKRTYRMVVLTKTKSGPRNEGLGRDTHKLDSLAPQKNNLGQIIC